MRGSAFLQMPLRVAWISVAGGLAVVVFGVVLSLIDPPSVPRASPPPVATLEPVDPQRTIDAQSDVSGKVMSPEGEGLESVVVELTPLFEGRGAKVRKTQTASDGRFAFEDVKIDLGSPYVVEAVFDGTRFPTPAIRAPRGTDPSVEITVASTTTSDADLVVEAESLAVIGDASGVQAVHALQVNNRGERAFVGELELPLLRGAQSIQETAGLDRRLLDLKHGAIVSTKPILPGPSEITYTYVTQMSRDGISLLRRPQLATKRYELLVSGDLTARDVRGLERKEAVTLDASRGRDRTYERSVAADVAAGTELRAVLALDTGSDVLRVGVPAAAGAIALALIVFGLIRRRRDPVGPSEPVSASTHTSA